LKPIKSVHYNDLIFKYFKHILLSYKTKQMDKTQVVNLSCVYVSVFMFKDKYYIKLTLIFQPIELFLSSYVIFNFSYSSCSYYLYLLYIVFASVYMYRRRLHKFTTCVLSICFVFGFVNYKKVHSTRSRKW
jgi:hypothetical protein